MIELSEKLFQTESGNAVIVAMDHALGTLAAPEGFVDPASTLDNVLRGKPDGIVAGPYFIRRFASKLSTVRNLKKVVTADYFCTSTIPGNERGMEIQDQLFSMSELASVRADAVKTALIFGRENPAVFSNNVKYVTRLAEEAGRAGLPYVVETALWGKLLKNKIEPKSDCVKIGFTFKELLKR